jgi:hypothetical protein
LLSVKYQPSDPVKSKIQALIEEAYEGASQEEWDEVAEKFRIAFAGEEDPPRTTEGDGRCEFEELIEGGVFSKYLEWTDEHESPTQFHFGSAVTAIAAGFGRKPKIDWEARDLYPNIYTLLVGPTGSRKGSAIERALRLVVPSMGTNLLPNEGTPQGFAAALRRRMGVTVDETADGLIVAPEFSVLLSRDRNKEELVTWLTDWYDSPPLWERALRGEEFYELRNVCVSVLGGSNLEWLRRMPTDAITGGYMPRHILFDAPNKRFWKARPRFSKSLGEELSRHLAAVGERIPETIGFDDGAGDYLDYWYEHEIRGAYESATDEQFRTWLSRKQAAAMKLACVWQLADGGPRDKITVEWLKRARRVIDWGDYTVERVYDALGVTQEGQVAADVLREITRAGGKVNRRYLMGKLKKKYNSGKVAGALQTLVQAGDIKKRRDSMEGVVWEVV